MSKDYWISGYETLTKLPEEILADTKSKNCDNIVINYSFEWQPYPPFKDLVKFIEKTGTSIEVIISNSSADDTYMSKEFPDIKVHFWPTYWFFFSVVCQGSQGYLLEQRPRESTTTDIPFLCMGGQPHLHRCITIDEMWKRGLQNKGKLSWPAGHTTNSLAQSRINSFPSEWSFSHFPGHQILLDEGWTLGSGSSFKLPIEFDNSSLIAITESQWQRVFVSEKTAMAILRKKPWLSLGGYKQHAFLKELGFAMMEDLIDYSFDNEENLEKRCSMFIDQIENWINMPNWNSIENTLYVKNIVDHNYKTLYNILANRVCFPDIVNKMLDDDTIVYSETNFLKTLKNFKPI